MSGTAGARPGSGPSLVAGERLRQVTWRCRQPRPVFGREINLREAAPCGVKAHGRAGFSAPRLARSCVRSDAPQTVLLPLSSSAKTASSAGSGLGRQRCSGTRRSGLLGTTRVAGGGAPACFAEVTQGESSGCRSRLRALAGGRTDSPPLQLKTSAVPEPGADPQPPGAALRTSWGDPAAPGSSGAGGNERPTRERGAGAGGGAARAVPARGSRGGKAGSGGTQKEFCHVAGSAEISPTYFHLEKWG